MDKVLLSSVYCRQGFSEPGANHRIKREYWAETTGQAGTEGVEKYQKKTTAGIRIEATSMYNLFCETCSPRRCARTEEKNARVYSIASTMWMTPIIAAGPVTNNMGSIVTARTT